MTNRRSTDFSKLIPELPSWNNGHGISVEAWIRCMGNFELAVGYSRVFWPEFVEHEGCILFEDFSLETYSAFMKQCNGDRARVEALMNHLHLVYLHAGATATQEQVV